MSNCGGKCTGGCCSRFPLPLSLQRLKRKSQNKEEINGTVKETEMLADMLIPLSKKAYEHKGERYFYYTCKHYDVKTHLCTVYEKRPSLCRTFPDNTLCSGSMENGCDATLGTPLSDARNEFRKAHGLKASIDYEYVYKKADVHPNRRHKNMRKYAWRKEKLRRKHQSETLQQKIQLRHNSCEDAGEECKQLL